MQLGLDSASVRPAEGQPVMAVAEVSGKGRRLAGPDDQDVGQRVADQDRRP